MPKGGQNPPTSSERRACQNLDLFLNPQSFQSVILSTKLARCSIIQSFQRADATLEGIRRPLQSVERVRTSIYSSILNPFNPSSFLPSLLAAQSFTVFNAPMPHWKELKGIERTLRAKVSIGDRLPSRSHAICG